jgi:2-polyprenyl-6-methoxyphenol hydroxylase-like FAD-dependent oxidoreductase
MSPSSSDGPVRTLLTGARAPQFANDRDGLSLRAEYLVGCDGGRSLIRKVAGIEFPGWDPTTSWLLAEVETVEEPASGFRRRRANHLVRTACFGIAQLPRLRLEQGTPVLKSSATPETAKDAILGIKK